MRVKNFYYPEIKKCDFWHKLSSCYEFKDMYWGDIFYQINGYIRYIKEYKNENISTYIYDVNKPSILDELGVDYNHIDVKGNTFFHYMLYENSHAKITDIKFKDCLKFVDSFLSKYPHLVYKKNDFNQNILFEICSQLSLTGIDGEKLDLFLKKYNDFNLNDKDNYNQNILTVAALKNPYLVCYLMDKGVDYKEPFLVMNKKRNVLSFYSRLNCNEGFKDDFRKIIRDVDMMYGEYSFLSTLLLNLERNDKNSIKWLNFISDLIIDDDFCNKPNILHKLKQHINQNKKLNEKEEDTQILSDAYKKLNYAIMSSSIIEKKSQKKTKI